MQVLKSLLDTPIFWEWSRIGFDLAIGLYRKRANLLHEWGLVGKNFSVLDIGCGTGAYARIMHGRYLGIDRNPRYIQYAQARHRRPDCSFRCGDITELGLEAASFDIVLMVDFLHHLNATDCLRVLQRAASLARHAVVSLEPVAEQYGLVGKWIVGNDRGEHMRSNAELIDLFRRADVRIAKSRELQLGPVTTRATHALPRQEFCAS